jgi:hypothetical protein
VLTLLQYVRTVVYGVVPMDTLKYGVHCVFLYGRVRAINEKYNKPNSTTNRMLNEFQPVQVAVVVVRIGGP